jgi:hypothetical protein
MHIGKKIALIGATVFFSTAAIIGCKFLPAPSSTPPIEQLKMSSNEISNWQPQGDMTVYIGDQLYGFNDGGAPEYLSRGCIKTGVQIVNGPSGRSAQAIVMDFGTDKGAKAMFDWKLKSVSTPYQDLGGYADTALVIQTTLDGVTGYAHFFNYYFEIGLTKFDNSENAVKTLDQFLGIYNRKLVP